MDNREYNLISKLSREAQSNKDYATALKLNQQLYITEFERYQRNIELKRELLKINPTQKYLDTITETIDTLKILLKEREKHGVLLTETILKLNTGEDK